jgi:hypothetical protein
LLANDLFSVKTKQGNNIKLDSIPKANVMINPQGPRCLQNQKA